MTASEKLDVYNLLKTASAQILGYDSKEFCGSVPEFADDPKPAETVSPEEAPVQNKTKGATLESIAAKISACQNCVLSKTRNNTVPGEGVSEPLVMVIGEGPGEEEDKTGRPFVGRAGQLLDKMLAAIKLDRNKNCYIANIVKCRPPNNRVPEQQEADACSGYLAAQIHILKPRAILAMGRTAVQNLMKTGQGINALRGKMLDYNGIPLMATYHPSALLHDESLKAPAWQDLKTFRKALLEIKPDYEA
ncbi:MAG: uracil-DNA glycosylase [Treponema sp.]|nr:uracil-DNA glycosylase [Treponema sp.]